MKRSSIIIIALTFLFLPGVGYGQPQEPSPDVYLQWMRQGIPIVNAATQDIVLPLPQTGISKYSFHYIYLFFGGTCTPGSVDNSSIAPLLGLVPNGSGNSTIQLGGLVQQNFTTSGVGTGPLLLIKGNGAANALSSTLHLVALNAPVLSGCTIDVLYKGTIREEEGANTVGVYDPNLIEMETGSIAPVKTVSGAMTRYRYTLTTPGSVGNRASVGIQQITFCILPISSTGLFRGTGPITLIANITYASGDFQPLGLYVVTNSCFTLSSQKANLGIMHGGDSLWLQFIAPTATGYPDTGELVGTVFGKVVY